MRKTSSYLYLIRLCSLKLNFTHNVSSLCNLTATEQATIWKIDEYLAVEDFPEESEHLKGGWLLDKPGTQLNMNANVNLGW